jgi:hypothetical protein
MIESLGYDGHAITIWTIAVLPRPIPELTATAVRRGATLLLLTATLAPTPLTLSWSAARCWRLLRNTVNAGEHRKERERSCNSQRAHSTR